MRGKTWFIEECLQRVSLDLEDPELHLQTIHLNENCVIPHFPSGGAAEKLNTCFHQKKKKKVEKETSTLSRFPQRKRDNPTVSERSSTIQKGMSECSFNLSGMWAFLETVTEELRGAPLRPASVSALSSCQLDTNCNYSTCDESDELLTARFREEGKKFLKNSEIFAT